MAKPEQIHESIQAAKKPARAPGAKDVSIAPGQPLHVHVMRDGEEVAHYLLTVQADSLQPVIHAAPEPDPPVSVPDPISDRRHMARAKKEE